jgi:hypothetical protein
MQTWEYHSIFLSATNEVREHFNGKVNVEGASAARDYLNNLGRQGWELAAVGTLSGGTQRLFFKRPAPLI